MRPRFGGKLLGVSVGRSDRPALEPHPRFWDEKLLGIRVG